MRRIILLVLTFFILSAAFRPLATGLASGNVDRELLAADQAKGQELARKISSIEVLAPLAPVALSPFFGIACLSGTSILSNRGVLPENDFLIGNKALDNGLIFFIFLALSILTSLPKMTTVSKGFAEVTDQLETYAAIISYLVIFYLAGVSQDTGSEQMAYSAGIFTFTRDTLLMLAVVINIVVINTVKYFFELLVWITPFPGLDAVFESANKIVTAGLVAIYAFSPYLAMIFNIILFLICLVFFNAVRRRIQYFKAIFIAPIIAKLFGKAGSLPPAFLKSRIAAIVEHGEPLMQVFPLRKVHKIKKKEKSFLTVSKEGLFLVKLRWIRQPKIEKLDTAHTDMEIICGLLSNTIEITPEGKTTPVRLAFSKIYNPQIESITAALKRFGSVRAVLNAAEVSSTEPAPSNPGLI